MNYESLYSDARPSLDTIKEKLKKGSSLSKTINNELESGDLKALKKDLQTMRGISASLTEAIDTLQAQLDAFDTEEYFKSGDFEEQMLESCRKNNVDVRADSPVYQMFPFKVKVDAENQEMYIGRKKISCMRPKSFVDKIKADQERLGKVLFNAPAFAQELAEAYDVALLKTGKRPGTDIYLQTLYKLLAPMSRTRKDYDFESFAFDVARLYEEYLAGLTVTKNGRRFQFGPSRICKNNVRVLDSTGKEHNLTTINFFKAEG